MRYLLVGDLHLTDRPRDAHRFGIFMGDLTDKTDKHTAVLINRIIDEFYNLEDFYVLMGNHDYVDPQVPYFRFLEPRFVHQPTLIGKNMFIPHTRSEAAFAKVCRMFAANKAEIDYCFCHQTFDGAIAETGKRLSGYKQAHIDQLKPRLGVYAGDIHRPQRAANVVYVGAPYHIRFGDDFDPRCILLDDDGKPKNLYFETVRKWSLTVRSAEDLNRYKRLLKGDQVKLTLELAREEAVEWKEWKRMIIEAAKAKGLEVFGFDLKVNSSTPKKVSVADVKTTTPDDILNAFCKTENVPSQIKQAGRMLLGENNE